jgi:hypothetical protein
MFPLLNANGMCRVADSSGRGRSHGACRSRAGGSGPWTCLPREIQGPPRTASAGRAPDTVQRWAPLFKLYKCPIKLTCCVYVFVTSSPPPHLSSIEYRSVPPAYGDFRLTPTVKKKLFVNIVHINT